MRCKNDMCWQPLEKRTIWLVRGAWRGGLGLTLAYNRPLLPLMPPVATPSCGGPAPVGPSTAPSAPPQILAWRVNDILCRNARSLIAFTAFSFSLHIFCLVALYASSSPYKTSDSWCSLHLPFDQTIWKFDDSHLSITSSIEQHYPKGDIPAPTHRLRLSQLKSPGLRGQKHHTQDRGITLAPKPSLFASANRPRRVPFHDARRLAKTRSRERQDCVQQSEIKRILQKQLKGKFGTKFSSRFPGAKPGRLR